MKISFVFVALIVGAVHFSRAQTNEKISLVDAFRLMAANTKNVFAPKARPVHVVSLTKDYNIHNYSVIASGRLDAFFQGVLSGKGQKFIEEARKNNICPLFLAAIAMHESANGKSLIARTKNNVFGIYLNKKYHSFRSVDECIEYAAKLLAGKIYRKNPTIAGVQKIYCPVGAANDPKGINKYWLSGVMSKMRLFWGENIYVTEA
jgi:hypothetical protein